MSWTLAIYILLLAGAVGVAEASHPTQICLDLTEEHVFETSNDDMIRAVQAWPGGTDAGHPPQHEGCVTELVEQGQDWTGTTIDFEIVGASDPDNADSPSTPDMTCTVGEGGSGCSVFPPSAPEGTQTIRGWIDFDQTTVEADAAEGVDEETDPGDFGEPDATDVVLWHWNTMDTTSYTTVTMRYDRRATAFRGNVWNDYSPCTAERTVKVFKRRSGGRRLMGSAVTNHDGLWRVEGPERAKGRFYAVAPATSRHTASPSTDMTCSRGVSSTIRVR